MNTPLKIGLAGLALFIAFSIGVAAANSGEPEVVTVEVTPQPTLPPIATPEPTPVIVTETVTVEVPVVPQACRDAIDAGSNQIAAGLDELVEIYSAYLDFPDEDIAEFGRRVEAIMVERAGRIEAEQDEFDRYLRLARRCTDG